MFFAEKKKAPAGAHPGAQNLVDLCVCNTKKFVSAIYADCMFDPYITVNVSAAYNLCICNIQPEPMDRVFVFAIHRSQGSEQMRCKT